MLYNVLIKEYIPGNQLGQSTNMMTILFQETRRKIKTLSPLSQRLFQPLLHLEIGSDFNQKKKREVPAGLIGEKTSWQALLASKHATNLRTRASHTVGHNWAHYFFARFLHIHISFHHTNRAAEMCLNNP